MLASNLKSVKGIVRLGYRMRYIVVCTERRLCLNIEYHLNFHTYPASTVHEFAFELVQTWNIWILP